MKGTFSYGGFYVSVKPLSPQDTVSRAVSLMREEDVLVLPVVSEKGQYMGLITVNNLLSSRLHPHTKVSSIMVKAPSCDLSSSPFDVVKLIVKTGVPGVAVIDGDVVVGIATPENLIGALNWAGGISAKDLMVRLGRFLTPSDPVDKARKIMAKRKVELIPLVSRRGLEGTITALDVLVYLYTTPLRRSRRGEKKGEVDFFLSTPLRNLMAREVRTLKATSTPSAEDIVEGAVVVNEASRPLGVITAYTVLKQLYPSLEELALPIRVEGLNGLDFFEKGLISKKLTDAARRVAKKGRLLEFSLVLKQREKTGGRVFYEATASIKLDKGVHTGKATGWQPVSVAQEAIEIALTSFEKFKARRRKIKMRRAREQRRA